MNMKKTIAAVAASALAISAVAVPAAALDYPTNPAITGVTDVGNDYTYSLVKGTWKQKAGSSKITSSFLCDPSADVIRIDLTNIDVTKAIEIIGTDQGNNNTRFCSYKFVLEGRDRDTFLEPGFLYVDGDGVGQTGLATDTTTTDAAGVVVTPNDKDYLYIDSKVLGRQNTSMNAKIEVTGSVYAFSQDNAAALSVIAENNDYLAIAIATDASITAAAVDVDRLQASDQAGTGDITASVATFEELGLLGGEALTEVDANYVVTNYTNASITAAAQTALREGVFKDVVSEYAADLAANATTGSNAKPIAASAAAVNNAELEVGSAFIPSTTLARTLVGFEASTYTKISWPFLTTATGWTALANTDGSSQSPAKPNAEWGNGYQWIGAADNGNSNVIARLDDLGYPNARAVFNDAVRNYNGVTFRFNTAVGNIITDTDHVYTWAYQAGTTATDNQTDRGYYQSFGENVYDQYRIDYKTDTVVRDPFDPDVMWNNSPVNYTLFNGALVLNEEFTMQLTDTDVFAVGADSITFDYATLKSRAYADYNYGFDAIISMQLHTSIPWFWDSLVVHYENIVDDTAESDAGTTGEDEILEDPTLDEDLDALDEVPEIVEVPEVVETPVVQNPETGNAPIALAVIPVALAAAAIIAKKRK